MFLDLTICLFARQVDDAEAKEYADSVGAHHVLVSAKTGKMVEEVFLELTKGMLKGAANKAAGAGGAGTAGKPESRVFVGITDDAKKKPEGGGCC